MLSSYRSGTPSTPFEIYCTQGLAYVAGRGHAKLTALLAARAQVSSEKISDVQVQAAVAGAAFADLLVTFQNGQRALVETQIELGGSAAHLPALEEASQASDDQPALIRLALPGDEMRGSWSPLSWAELADCLEDYEDPLTSQYVEFIRKDILGQGDVPLDDAITTNRLYALGAAALRRRFQNQVSYQSSASPPVRGRYRYIGTTFGVGEGSPEYWVGLVNEGVPLTEHYHLMLASKEAAVLEPVEQPRVTSDWKWGHWTGLGRVVRALTPESFDELLSRLSN